MARLDLTELECLLIQPLLPIKDFPRDDKHTDIFRSTVLIAAAIIEWSN